MIAHLLALIAFTSPLPDTGPQVVPVVQQIENGKRMFYSCEDGAPLYVWYWDLYPDQYLIMEYDGGAPQRLDTTTRQFGPHFTDGFMLFKRKSTAVTLEVDGRILDHCLL